MYFIKNNILYYGLYLLVLFVASYYLLCVDKLILHQNVNSIVGSKWWDIFYSYFTHVGDGVFALLIGIMILVFNIKKGIYVLASYIVAGSFTALLKNFVFDDKRPHHVFSYYYKEIKIKYIEGIDMIGENSFPSGHATTAFALFTALALLTRNQFLKVFYLVIAINAAFSRTYLSQHWVIDIYTGPLIGVIITTLLYFVFMRPDFAGNLNRPLLKQLK